MGQRVTTFHDPRGQVIRARTQCIANAAPERERRALGQFAALRAGRQQRQCDRRGQRRRKLQDLATIERHQSVGQEARTSTDWSGSSGL